MSRSELWEESGSSVEEAMNGWTSRPAAWNPSKAGGGREDLCRRRGEKRQGREAGRVSYTWRWEMSCPTVISSAIFWYKLWLFKTMLSRMARDLWRMDTSTIGWLTYPAIWRQRGTNQLGSPGPMGAGWLRLLLLAHRLSPLKCVDHIGQVSWAGECYLFIAT